MSDVKAMSFPKIKTFLSFLRVLGSGVLMLWLCTACAKPAPIFGEVPDFTLQDQEGMTVVKKDLEGTVWVADFIYTGCGSACPLLTQRLSETGKLFRQDPTLRPVRLVSFTVDPETDTPKRLREYAERFGASRDRWLFLTGSVEHVRQTVTNGFKLAYEKADAVDVFHSEKIVVIDADGRIRGYFDSDQNGLKALRKAVESLRDPPKKG